MYPPALHKSRSFHLSYTDPAADPPLRSSCAIFLQSRDRCRRARGTLLRGWLAEQFAGWTCNHSQYKGIALIQHEATNNMPNFISLILFGTLSTTWSLADCLRKAGAGIIAIVSSFFSVIGICVGSLDV